VEVSPKAPTPPPDRPPDSPTLNTADVGDIAIDQESPAAVVDQEIIAARAKKRRLAVEKKAIEGMYCPCPGFAYNSLSGERNVLVSCLPLLVMLS
jgi:hypothetical protein